MTARRVGDLALEYLHAAPVHGGAEHFRAALADLRALMAEREERSREAASTAAECARLRAALENINSQPASAAKVACSMRLIARAALAHEERSGAAASTAGVKP